MNFGALLLCLLIGIVFGVICGALWMVIKVMLSQRKALRDYKNKKIIEVKNSPKEKIEEKLDVLEPIKEKGVKDKSILNKLFKNKK